MVLLNKYVPLDSLVEIVRECGRLSHGLKLAGQNGGRLGLPLDINFYRSLGRCFNIRWSFPAYKFHVVGVQSIIPNSAPAAFKLANKRILSVFTWKEIRKRNLLALHYESVFHVKTAGTMRTATLHYLNACTRSRVPIESKKYQNMKAFLCQTQKPPHCTIRACKHGSRPLSSFQDK